MSAKYIVNLTQEEQDKLLDLRENQKNQYPALLKRISDYAYELTTLAGYLFTP